jgi:hypothetical protein
MTPAGQYTLDAGLMAYASVSSLLITTLPL